MAPRIVRAFRVLPPQKVQCAMLNITYIADKVEVARHGECVITQASQPFDLLAKYLSISHQQPVRYQWISRDYPRGDRYLVFFTDDETLCLCIECCSDKRWAVVDYRLPVGTPGEVLMRGASPQHCAWTLGANLRLSQEVRTSGLPMAPVMAPVMAPQGSTQMLVASAAG